MPIIASRGGASAFSLGFAVNQVPKFINTQVLVVGGGGNNGGSNGGGGGGGGGVATASQCIGTKSNYCISVGGAGSSSYFYGVSTVSAGGGVSGYDGAYCHAGNGGASGTPNVNGGGGGLYVTFPAGPPGWCNGGSGFAGGGGGGAGGGGSNGTSNLPNNYRVDGGPGGDGGLWTPNGQRYGAGAGGSAVAYGPGCAGAQCAFGGGGGAGYANYGHGGGGTGGVILSYTYRKQLYCGGTVTSTGSGATTKWFHSFSGSGTLVHR